MGESVSKSSYKTAELEAYRFDKAYKLPKEKITSFTERLPGSVQLSGMDSIVAQSSSCQEGMRTVPV